MKSRTNKTLLDIKKDLERDHIKNEIVNIEKQMNLLCDMRNQLTTNYENEINKIKIQANNLIIIARQLHSRYKYLKQDVDS